MSTINDLMLAVAQMEGFNIPGTISQRANNPGNLRWAANQSGTIQAGKNGTFATFATPEEGWAALESYINKNSGMTLRNFIAKYAPPSENDTVGYLGYLVKKLGISPDDTVGVLSVNNGGSTDSNIVADNSDSESTSGIDEALPMLLAVTFVGVVVKLSS